MADIKTTIASITLVAALAGGVYEGTVEDKTTDVVLPGEKVELRTDVSSTVDLGGGRRATQVFTRPIHYKDADSVYKAIQTDVYKRPLLIALLSKYEYKTDAGPYKAYYDAEKPWNYYAESADGKRWIEFEALFDESEDLTIDVKSKWNGVKEIVTLKSEKAPTELQWLFKMEGMEHSKPKAWDAGLNPVPVTMKTAGDTLIYTVETKDATYPVMIDPSATFVDTDNMTGFLHADSDSFRSARDSTAATSADATTGIAAGFYIPGSRNCSRGLLRFDSSGLPDNAMVDSFKVKVALWDTTYYRSVPGIWIKMIETNDDLSITEFATNTWIKFKGYVAGINQAYTPNALTDSIKVASGTAYKDTLTFNGHTARNTEISLTGTTQMFLLSQTDITAGAYNNTTNLHPYFEDDSSYLLVYYHLVSKYGGATLKTLGGAVLSKFGGAL